MKTLNPAILLGVLIVSACAASENPAIDGTEALEAAETQVSELLKSGVPTVLAPGTNVRATETSAHDGGNVVYQFGDYEGQGTRAAFAIRWNKNEAGTWQLDRSLTTPMPPNPVVLAVMQPARSNGAPLDDDIARNEVNQRMAELAAAVNAQDAKRIASFWAADAQFFQPAVQRLNAAAPGGFMAERGATQRIEFTPRDNFVHDDGNVVYQFGTYHDSVGQAQYLARFRRNAEGVWLIDRFLSELGRSV